MSTLQPMAFDVFSGDEAALMRIGERADDAWAKPMIAAINRNGGLVGGNKDRFLELRFGHALRKAGINPEYEIAGEGDSTLDFGFKSEGKGWSVELMRLYIAQQLNLLVSERADLLSINHDHADEFGVPKHGYSDERPSASEIR
jgi:hypothetical protein